MCRGADGQWRLCCRCPLYIPPHHTARSAECWTYQLIRTAPVERSSLEIQRYSRARPAPESHIDFPCGTVFISRCKIVLERECSNWPVYSSGILLEVTWDRYGSFQSELPRAARCGGWCSKLRNLLGHAIQPCHLWRAAQYLTDEKERPWVWIRNVARHLLRPLYDRPP